MNTVSAPSAVSPLPALHAEKHRGHAALADSALELARLVLVRGPVSRGELAKELKLSVASLTRLGKPLIDAGLLVEGELLTDGTVGRPVRLLDVRSDSAWFVGVKVAGDVLRPS